MIKKCDYMDIPNVTRLALLLWPNHSYEELEEEISNYILSNDSAIFIKCKEDVIIAFAEGSLRTDYVEGTNSSHVGYLEGIFVREDFRGIGIAKDLVLKCESWAKQKGCVEFASNCELGNIDSLEFHKKIGFKEVQRIICFSKKI